MKIKKNRCKHETAHIKGKKNKRARKKEPTEKEEKNTRKKKTGIPTMTVTKNRLSGARGGERGEPVPFKGQGV